jgi:site-specific DNA-methyltransferase (adenine-specific)
MSEIKLYNDDCLNILKTLDDNSVDSCVTDPPYGLSFMGKSWDYDVPKTEIWKEVYRVLKPGAHLLSFFGSRTYHRGVVQIEDAGFEIRDQIMWLYGSGFPKSHNIGDGLGTALKPAHEPIVVARKPITQTVAKNVLEYGTGALNIDGCRVESNDVENIKPFGSMPTNKTDGKGFSRPWMNDKEKVLEKQNAALEKLKTMGRWPANVIHDGSDEVASQFPDSNGSGPERKLKRNPKPYQEGWGMNKNAGDIVELPDGGSGSAARFFYCAKASKSDRGSNNNHPTVKPTELMKYLCRLVTPKKGIVLDPFMGSGSTGKAALQEGFSFIGIEMSKEYFDIAKGRVENNISLEKYFS